jgi:hypothetical protein
MAARRLAAPPVLISLLALMTIGCGRSGGPGPNVSPATRGHGPVPALVDGPLVALTRCDRTGDQVRIEAVLTNERDGAVLLQGVPFSVDAGDGSSVIDEDDTSGGLWSSVTIGPGRQTLLATTADVSGAPPGALTCSLGEPDLRDAAALSTDAALPLGDVALRGCGDGATVDVTNRHDEPVATAVTVEFFDDHGYSAGQLTVGQAPTTYTDGRDPGPFDVALPPGATAAYPITILERIAQWGTPVAGPIASCEVVAAGITIDPPPGEVIVD